MQNWSSGFSFKLKITVVPTLNLDGVLRGQRTNARGVDLNRNMGTNDWSAEIKSPRYHPGPSPNSEPETQSLVRWLDQHKPVFVLSLHSWHPILNINGNCEAEAKAISQWTKYKIAPAIGYPTPGCLGTYCGLERDMPTLTYEIERGLTTEVILSLHVRAIEECLKVTEFAKQVSL